MRVEPVTHEPWALATQHVRDRAFNGARLRYSLMVRVEGATGNGAGAFYLAQGAGGVTLDHRQSLVKGTADWQRISVEFKVPQGAEGFEVGLIVEGPGRVWVDEARLELLEPGPSGKKPL